MARCLNCIDGDCGECTGRIGGMPCTCHHHGTDDSSGWYETDEADDGYGGAAVREEHDPEQVAAELDNLKRLHLIRSWKHADGRGWAVVIGEGMETVLRTPAHARAYTAGALSSHQAWLDGRVVYPYDPDQDHDHE